MTVVVPIGRLTVATPETMAESVRGNTVATQAVDERIVEVTPGIIADSPTVIAAATAAVDEALLDATLVDGRKEQPWMTVAGGQVGGGFTDPAGNLSPFMWTPEARLHPHSAKVIGEDAAGMIDTFSPSYTMAMTDAAGNIMFAVLPDGGFWAPGGIVGSSGAAQSAESEVIPIYAGSTLSVLDPASGKISPVTTGGTVVGEPQACTEGVTFRVGSQLRWSGRKGGPSYPVLADATKSAGWGSSTAGGIATALASAMASIGSTYYDGGRGGETAEHTLARMGVRPVSLAGFTIPTSGGVTVVPLNIPSNNITYSDTVTVAGIAGTLSRPSGTPNTWTFTRTASGAATVVAEGTPALSTVGEAHRGDLMILNIGKNNFTGVGGNPTVEQVIAWTLEAYRFATHLARQVIVLGHFVDTNTDGDSSARVAIIAYNKAMKAAVGDRFIDLQELLTSATLWAATGITPVTADFTQQGLGNKPPSISSDDLHLNAAGYTYLSAVIKARIIALGWA